MNKEECLSKTVPPEFAGRRLDQVLAELFSDYSRSRLQSWIKSERVKVDNRILPAKTRLAGGEQILLQIEHGHKSDPQHQPDPEKLPLNILFEDEDLIVINKQAGLVMHPAAGNWSGTVQNGLLHLCPALSDIPRAGIVHRLDKDTSGLFVVAKTLRAHKSLVEQLQQRSVRREYRAIVNGTPVSGGTLDRPIGRHRVDRRRMAVRESGKEAITHYRLEERFRAHTLLSVKLETGRTHQIRVHLSSIGYPLLGDSVYGGRPRFPAHCSDDLRSAISNFKRQALHAWRLTLRHPKDKTTASWTAEMPDDMGEILDKLRRDSSHHA